MKKKERNIKKWNKHTCPSKNVCLYVRPVPPIGDKVQNPMASKSKNKRNRKEKKFQWLWKYEKYSTAITQAVFI